MKATPCARRPAQLCQGVRNMWWLLLRRRVLLVSGFGEVIDLDARPRVQGHRRRLERLEAKYLRVKCGIGTAGLGMQVMGRDGLEGLLLTRLHISKSNMHLFDSTRHSTALNCITLYHWLRISSRNGAQAQAYWAG